MPILREMSLLQVASLQMVPPRETNSCLILELPTLVCNSICDVSLNTACTSVLTRLIVSLNLLFVTLLTVSCRPWSLSESKLISSANVIRSKCYIITTSRKMLNNNGDRTQPCNTPTTVGNQFDRPPSTLWEHSLYLCIKIPESW